MPALVAGIYVFVSLSKEDVDGRVNRAFTPVFDGLCPAITMQRDEHYNIRVPAWPDLAVAAIMAGLFLTSSVQILRQSVRELRGGEASGAHEHHGHAH
jgi:hypothetical protein